MLTDFDRFLKRSQQRMESALPRLLGEYAAEQTTIEAFLTPLYEASRYTLTDGGKRVRPVLVFAAAEALNCSGPSDALDRAACAVEMLHSYSLVHDDLPAMDDDPLRRGKPSCHVAYSEATALLVGDGLQAHAFQLLAETAELPTETRLAMISVLSRAVGFSGMVGGQAVDIAATDSELSLAQLQSMHRLKTGALIRASLALGGHVGQADKTQLRALDDFGRDIGLAFQVVDDILDVESDTETLGKTQGKDEDANKSTYVKLLGLEGARHEAQNLLDQAISAVHTFGSSANRLRDLAHFIVERKH